MTTVSMVVMEPGSEWPGQIGDSTNLVAFCQGGEELVRRTQARLGALLAAKQIVRVAVLACNGTTDGATAGRRTRLAQMLLGVMVRTTRGRLVFSASGDASHRLREELLALADTLTAELRGTTTTISLRFSPRTAAPLAKTRPTVMTGTDG